VAIFVLVPMASALFRDANIPKQLMPAAVALGTSTFTMSMLPGTPAVQNAIPMPFFGTTPFAAPGLGIVASVITLSFGLWWLTRRQHRAAARGQGYGVAGELEASNVSAANDLLVRERATVAHDFDPAEVQRGQASADAPGLWIAALPLLVVLVVNFLMTAVILPALDLSYLDRPEFGPATPSAVTGIWSVSIALAVAIVVLLLLNRSRLSDVRASIDAGVNASVLPIVSVASLVGFGTVVANLPAFEMVRQWVLGIGGGPLVSLALSTNVLAALTGSASGGLTIALEALGPVYLGLASELSIDPALLHRVAVIGAGTLDVLPHNGAVVTLLAVCGMTHRDSYGDIVMVSIVGALLALVAVIVLGSVFGSF
jgi:H+/gluconate symporter-like permease